MSFPLAIGICENDLKRDISFLKAFAGSRTDLRITPLHGGRLDTKIARFIGKQIAAALDAGLQPRAIVIHHDVDRRSLNAGRDQVSKWFRKSGLANSRCRLVVCAPAPCLERWLCLAMGIHARGTNPSAGCDPWKKVWTPGIGYDLDRVRQAAEKARAVLAGLDDFDAFFSDWKRAGMEPR